MNASQLGPDPVLATPESVRRAREYVRGLEGMGGTQMIEGIKAALDFPHDPERLRFVTFLTDGYIGNELEILSAIHEGLGDSRIFSFGVGSSVNRYLLERMAGVGRGAVAYLGLQDSGREVMDFFFDRVSHPALIDVGIEWGNMHVSDVYPSRLPDLFVGRPVVVTGKYLGEAREPRIRGRAAGRAIEFALPHDGAAPEHSFIPSIWARLRIADLADRQAWANDPYNDLAREIRDTALAYGLMSDHTAFVAVDASRVTEGDRGTTVFQGVPVPEGVRYETTVNR
jgi:Ca-activated chloride channel family protein